MTKKERLEAIISHYCDGKPSLFAKQIGVAPSTISSWFARDTLDYDLLFAKCENISPEWLLTGRGEMLKQDVPSVATSGADAADGRPILSDKDTQNYRITQEIGQGIPYYDVDFIGGFSEILNSQVTVPACNVVVPGFEKAQLWCNVTGHSMEPKINHGDIIALRECSISDIQYGEIYAVVLDTIRTIKILRRGTTPDVLRYVPINVTNFDEQEYPLARILKVYEVLGSIARFF